jgi:DNA-directed RNA polymerase
LLKFAEPKPLGKDGFFWLKVSLANLLGKDKLPFDERVAFVDASRDWIMKVAQDPLTPQNIKHWANADDGPWQALARCFELAEVWRTGDEEGFLSYLPVHLDGSCNGLQHYAALGRDQFGALAVNVLPSDRPQDVYTIVLGIVKEKVQHDAHIADNDSSGKNGQLARRLIELGVLQRKVVKQTIMTICYGVTTVGAKQQVQGHLASLVADQVGPEELSILASYLSKLVLKSIGEVFERAMAIKAWFDTATQHLNQLEMPTAWFSPIGLACVQPYKKMQKVECVTKRQKVTLAQEDGPKVDKARQRMGFPPNFIHSLDATHMMITAEGCQHQGIAFAGVHDSFWTHACDVPALNRIIRSAFIELHSQPLLQELYEDLHVRLGGLELPEPPAQGQLDLTAVSNSPYFFS